VKLLITGGAGYIGSVCAARLVEAGHEVVVLDDLSTGHADAVPDGARLVRGRVQDAGQFLDPGFDAVLHFAGRSLVAESVAKPELYWDANVIGTIALLDAMRRHDVHRLVFSSSAAAYGQAATSPITEDMATDPVNPYGVTKMMIDRMLAAEAAAHGLGAISLRYFNVGGAYGRFGERHTPETHLVPNLLKVASGGVERASVFGTDYPTPDGTAVRDYLHILDLAEAHIAALGALSEGDESPTRLRPGTHRVINLGSGHGYSVREVLDAVRRVTGAEVPAVELPRRAGDPPVLVASNDRASTELGWFPTRGLDEIVADAWAFQQDDR
jgi:UDP-glucose 4-epimerase